MRRLAAAVVVSIGAGPAQGQPGNPSCSTATGCCRQAVNSMRSLELYRGTEVNYEMLIEEANRACDLGLVDACAWGEALTADHCPPGFGPFCAVMGGHRARFRLDGGLMSTSEVRRALQARDTRPALPWKEFVNWSRATIHASACQPTDAGR